MSRENEVQGYVKILMIHWNILINWMKIIGAVEGIQLAAKHFKMS